LLDTRIDRSRKNMNINGVLFNISNKKVEAVYYTASKKKKKKKNETYAELQN